MRGLNISRRQVVRVEVAKEPLEKQWVSRSSVATVAFDLGGKIVGGGFLNAFAEMQRAQWLTTEELQARNDVHLKKLLKHAAENVPFYSQHYKRSGLISESLQNARDLTVLPVLSKTDYRKRQSEEFYATNTPDYRRLEKTTSGSTGEPFQFCLDRRAMPIIFASHLFYDSWHGLRPFDRYIRIAATPPTSPSLPSHTPAVIRLRQAITSGLQSLYERWTQERISVWEVDADRALSIWRRIESFHPKFVMGYTSSLAAIADELLRLNLPLAGRSMQLSPLPKR
jgi:phenylacetate-CoA ligase